jgi:hypothetical protein
LPSLIKIGFIGPTSWAVNTESLGEVAELRRFEGQGELLNPRQSRDV